MNYCNWLLGNGRFWAVLSNCYEKTIQVELFKASRIIVRVLDYICVEFGDNSLISWYLNWFVNNCNWLLENGRFRVVLSNCYKKTIQVGLFKSCRIIVRVLDYVCVEFGDNSLISWCLNWFMKYCIWLPEKGRLVGVTLSYNSGFEARALLDVQDYYSTVFQDLYRISWWSINILMFFIQFQLQMADFELVSLRDKVLFNNHLCLDHGR